MNCLARLSIAHREAVEKMMAYPSTSSYLRHARDAAYLSEKLNKERRLAARMKREGT